MHAKHCYSNRTIEVQGVTSRLVVVQNVRLYLGSKVTSRPKTSWSLYPCSEFGFSKPLGNKVSAS